MTFPDKVSEASKQQLATQIDFFQSLTSRMFENAERILALNIQATRTTLDQTSGAVRQLAAARDPRDLLALGAQSQQQIEAAMAYSRKLFEIANKPAVTPAPAAAASAPAPAPAAAPTAAAASAEHIDTAPPVVASVDVPQAAPEPVTAPEPEPEPAPTAAPAQSAILPSKHPMGEADPEPAPVVIAKAKPIAKAASEVAAAPVDTPHPAASPMPDAGPVAIPAITSVDAKLAPLDAGDPAPAKKAGGKGSGKKR